MSCGDSTFEVMVSTVILLGGNGKWISGTDDSPLCRCKECANQNGIRMITTTKQGQERRSHDSKYRFNFPCSSKSFALDRGESVFIRHLVEF